MLTLGADVSFYNSGSLMSKEESSTQAHSSSCEHPERILKYCESIDINIQVRMEQEFTKT